MWDLLFFHRFVHAIMTLETNKCSSSISANDVPRSAGNVHPLYRRFSKRESNFSDNAILQSRITDAGVSIIQSHTEIEERFDDLIGVIRRTNKHRDVLQRWFYIKRRSSSKSVFDMEITSVTHRIVIRREKPLNEKRFTQLDVLNEWVEKCLGVIRWVSESIREQQWCYWLEVLSDVEPWRFDPYCRRVSSSESRIQNHNLSTNCSSRQTRENVWWQSMTMMMDRWRDEQLESNIPEMNTSVSLLASISNVPTPCPSTIYEFSMVQVTGYVSSMGDRMPLILWGTVKRAINGKWSTPFVCRGKNNSSPDSRSKWKISTSIRVMFCALCAFYGVQLLIKDGEIRGETASWMTEI